MALAGWLFGLVALVAFGIERAKREKLRAIMKNTGAFLPLPTTRLQDIDPVFTPDRFGPTRATEVSFIGHGPIAVPGGTSDGEAWVLAVLAKKAECLFEFGTCTGKTAYLWSRNAPANAQIVTLTLGPTQRDSYQSAAGDNTQDERFALEESNFTEFIYSDTRRRCVSRNSSATAKASTKARMSDGPIWCSSMVRMPSRTSPPTRPRRSVSSNPAVSSSGTTTPVCTTCQVSFGG